MHTSLRGKSKILAAAFPTDTEKNLHSVLKHGEFYNDTQRSRCLRKRWTRRCWLFDVTRTASGCHLRDAEPLQLHRTDKKIRYTGHFVVLVKCEKPNLQNQNVSCCTVLHQYDTWAVSGNRTACEARLLFRKNMKKKRYCACVLSRFTC